MSDVQLKHKIASFLANKVKKFPGGKFGKQRFFLTNFAYRFLSFFKLDYSRGIEWKFVIKNIPKGDRKLKILDIGSRSSLFIYKLTDYFDNVIGFDVEQFHERLPVEIKFIIGDVMNISLDSGSIDIITLISVIEHVGLGYYGDPVGSDGDSKAMRGLRRVLRNGGMIFLTTQIGNEYIVTPNNNERIYGPVEFDKLVNGFSIVVEEYYIFRKRWVLVEKEKAFQENPKRSGLACIQLIKE